MRSIALKLILAFLCISLVTVAVVVTTTQRSTDREFNQFLLSIDQQTITSLFTEYYAEKGSWDSVTDAAPVLLEELKIQLDERGHLPFTLTDSAYNVILAGGMYQPGDIMIAIDQHRSVPIFHNDQVVGHLDIRSPMPVPEPSRDLFIQRIQINLLIIAVAAVLLSLILGWIFSRIISRPIRDLTAAALEVSRGNLDQSVQIRSKDEIGELARVFNEMTSKLDQLLKARKQMTADIAHELRTPISVILGHAEGIHDGVIPASNETLEIIREESIRLEHLVNDLRMLALSDAGELQLDQKAVGPVALMNIAYDHFHFQAQARGITLKMNLDPDLPAVLMDLDRMTQVISNIMENAIRNTPAGGEIVLSARLTGRGDVEFSVEDNGYGIEKGDLDRIFDRLYRSDQSRQRDKGGTGLGLALAKMIVEQHSGKIRAESEPGQGTKMVIILPIVIRNGESI